MQLGADAAVAEDLAQETLAEAWRLRDRIYDAAGIERWLLAILRNVHQRWAERSARERSRVITTPQGIRTPVCFLDEPTVGLDPDGAYQVREFITRELVGSGTSGILTTHRMSEAEDLCARVAIMDRGRIVAAGTPRELKQSVGERSVLEVRAEPVPREVVEAVRRLSGVRAAVTAPAGEDGLEESLRVHCEDLDATPARVRDTLAASGVVVHSMNAEEPSLEDVFIAVTNRRID